MNDSQYAPPNAPQGDPTAPRRGWFGRNWLWFLPTVLILPPLMCLGCCGGGFTMLINGLRKAEPFQIALQRLNDDAEVSSQLGTPIESDLLNFNGNVNYGTDGGTANYTFTARGPKGTAHVHFEARKPGEQWVFDTFDVTLPDAETITLAD